MMDVFVAVPECGWSSQFVSPSLLCWIAYPVTGDPLPSGSVQRTFRLVVVLLTSTGWAGLSGACLAAMFTSAELGLPARYPSDGFIVTVSFPWVVPLPVGACTSSWAALVPLNGTVDSACCPGQFVHDFVTVTVMDAFLERLMVNRAVSPPYTLACPASIRAVRSRVAACPDGDQLPVPAWETAFTLASYWVFTVSPLIAASRPVPLWPQSVQSCPGVPVLDPVSRDLQVVRVWLRPGDLDLGCADGLDQRRG